MACAATLVFALACGSRAPDRGLPLVRVGSVVLTLSDLQRFESSLPEHLRPPGEGEDAVRDVLQSMVDREIMILEARRQGCFDAPRVLKRRESTENRELVDRLYRSADLDTTVGEEEARARFVRNDIGRMLLAAHIVCETEEEARRALERVEAGEPFGEVAREMSRAPDAPLGGERRRLITFGMLPVDVHEVVWRLAPGEHTRVPLVLPNGYEIIKVQEVRYRTFEERREIYMQRLRVQKLRAARRDLVSQWSDRLHLGFYREGIDALLSGDPTGEAEASDAVVAGYEGGEMTAGEAAKALTRNGRLPPALSDSAGIARALYNGPLTERLLVQAARQLGLDADPDLRRRLGCQHVELAVKELWHREVRERVTVLEGEVRELYEARKADTEVPAFVQIREVLVAELAVADELRRRIEQGEGLGAVARQRSQRSGSRVSGGLLHIHEDEAGLYPGLFAAAMEAEVGELVGPLRVAEGYSLFQVEERQEAGPQSFERLRPRLRLEIRRNKEGAAVDSLIGRLRERYAARVEWHDEAIHAEAQKRQRESAG